MDNPGAESINLFPDYNLEVEKSPLSSLTIQDEANEIHEANDPSDPNETGITLDLTPQLFLDQLRAYELHPNNKYLIFVPPHMFERISTLLSQLKDIEWGGVVLPATFLPDGKAEIAISTAEKMVEWVMKD